MIIERNSILDVLSKVVGITDRHNVMPILRNVKLSFGETSTITATDLEVSAIVALPKADEELTLLLNGRILLDILKGLNPGDVEFVKDDSSILIKQGKTSYTLALESVEDFPSVEGDIKDIAADFTIDTKTLIGAIKKVEYSVSQDETRYSMCGVRLASKGGKLATVSTDGFRLSLNTKDVVVDMPGVTIPRKAVGDIYNIVGMGENVRVVAGRAMIKFITSTSTLVCRVIDMAYPDFEAVISNVNGGHNDATVDKAEFLKAVKKVLVVADSDRLIKASFSSGLLRLETQGNVGRASETIPLEYDGGNITLTINGRYLSDVLAYAVDENIKLKVPKPGEFGSIFFIENDASALGIIMPIKA
jgi:DNA polymerase-3 subunit beta